MMNTPFLHDVSPRDEHNQLLLRHVHPPDWRNPEPAGRYNLVVIGAGTAGLVTAAGAAGLGAKVALIERHLMGGDCLNVGCVPSKLLIAAARRAATARDSGEFGVRVPRVEVDFPAVMERLRRLRAQISKHDSAQRFTELGVDVFLGAAQFTGPDTVTVGGKTLRFKRAVIATGARAIVLPIPGLAEAQPLTNETIFNLTELPRRLTVIGAGPIGCEMAQTFRRFGAEVTLLETAPRILIREDADAAGVLQQRLIADGVRVVTAAKIARVEVRGAEKIIHYELNGAAQSVTSDAILVGVGRAPNVEGLGLETVGVVFDKQAGVQVNDRLQTTNPRIYAAGDICMKWKFTHAADFAARIVIQNALFLGRKKLSALNMPWCTYTEPEIAHVGLYESEAKERGLAVDTYTRHLREVDRCIAEGETEGFVRIHTRRGTDEILGATIVAPRAGDLISEISVAMAGRLGLGKLANVIHPYPTHAEALRQCGDAYNRTRLTPAVKRLMQRWLAWLRR